MFTFLRPGAVHNMIMKPNVPVMTGFVPGADSKNQQTKSNNSSLQSDGRSSTQPSSSAPGGVLIHLKLVLSFIVFKVHSFRLFGLCSPGEDLFEKLPGN